MSDLRGGYLRSAVALGITWEPPLRREVLTSLLAEKLKVLFEVGVLEIPFVTIRE